MARGFAVKATETTARDACAHLPISLVGRARALLGRFFSDDPWGPDDDSALASIVGPGSSRESLSLDPEITLEWGWRAGAFRVDVRYEPAGADPDERRGPGDPTSPHRRRRDDLLGGSVVPQHQGTSTATLASTFDGPVVPEAQPADTAMRFLTGPGSGGSSLWYRSPDASDVRVRRLFEAFGDDLAGVQLGPGSVLVEIRDASRWHDLMLPLIGRVAELFAPPRPPLRPDRQAERAHEELSALDAENPRDLARICDALTSPDPAYREIAVVLLAGADPFTAERGWRAALDDGSRSVRRSAVAAMADAGSPQVRPLLERALADSDACVRYHGIRGLARLSVARSEAVIAARMRDLDGRVRLAAAAALAGHSIP